MNDKELHSLIQLLDDNDSEVTEIVTGRLINHGPEIIPALEKAWELSLNPLVQEKLEGIVHQVQFNAVKNDFTNWIRNGSDNILYGAYLVARYQFPDLLFSDFEKEMSLLHRQVWVEFHEDLTALEKVRVINHILFAVHKYSANVSNFYSPANSFINQVFETKLGNPISLSVIYSALAQSLGLPVYGVNLPLNYLVAYVMPDYADDPDGILFYINPYNRGIILSRKELDFFLFEQKLEQKPEYYKPCSNTVTIERMLRNLQFSYEKMGMKFKSAEITELLMLFSLNINNFN